jgi:RNA polymerase primary sigma factor
MLPLVDEDSLRIYLREISRNMPLASSEEAELSARIRKGDREAFDKLVLANLRFVVSVSHLYANQGLPLCDLINEGNLGLMRAARRFDERKNFRFISYAVWWIRQAILQALAEQSRIVRLPLNRVGSIQKIGQAQRRLQQRNQRSPDAVEIADELGVREGDVLRMLRVGNRHASFDAPSGDSGGSLYDQIGTDQRQEVEDALTYVSLRRELGRSLAVLQPREREIIMLYFGMGCDSSHTLGEIGQRFGLTRERVRQIKEKALDKLKRPCAKNRLRQFCEEV